MLPSPAARRAAGLVGQRLGLNQLAYYAQRALVRPMIRAINYHSVPRARQSDFESHLRYFAERYENVTLEQLDAFFDGEWRPRRPGMIISFDDGLRTDFDVVAPALERYGFTGWFFVPVNLIELPVEEQVAAACAARVTPLEDAADGRVFMTPAEVRTLAQRHVIGCHTASHVRLSSALGPERLQAEIVDTRGKLAAQIGAPVDVFCWVGGEEWSYSRTAAQTIRDTGYSFAFMTNSAPIRPSTNPLQLQRTNIEAHYSVPLVGLFLSGVMDARYARKRRRVNAATDVGQPLGKPDARRVTASALVRAGDAGSRHDAAGERV